MPNDLLAIKKIYPDSQIAYKFYHYIIDIIKNTEHRIPIESENLPLGWFKFADDILDESDEIRILAVGSEMFSKGITENLRQVMEQKFLATRNDYKNVEATWYLQYKSGTDPWCIYARSSDRRTAKRPCVGGSYRAYLSPGGMVRLAKESYFGNKSFASEWKQAITGLAADQIVGMKFVCFNIENDTAVRVELWLDELNINDWKLKDSFTDMGNNWGSGMGRCGCSNDQQAITWGGPIVGFTCEGSSPSNTDYLFSNMTVREINAGGQFAEAQAGDAYAIAGGGSAMASAGGTVADTNTNVEIVADGAGGAADDTSTGTGDNNITDPSHIVQVNGSTLTTGFPFPFPTYPGTGGTSSAPIGSPSSATTATPTIGSNQTPERPLVTVYKDLGLMYNIVLDSSSSCDIGNPFVIDYRQLYQTSGVETQEIKMFAKSGGFIKAGLKARSSISVIVGHVIRKVTVPLRKFGNPTTGILQMEIRDKNGNLQHTFPKADFGIGGSYPNGGDPAAVLTGAFGPGYTFTSDANTHTCQTGDMLVLAYNNSTDADANNCIILKSTDKDEIDGFDTCQVTMAYPGTLTGVYITNQQKDFIATIFK